MKSSTLLNLFLLSLFLLPLLGYAQQGDSCSSEETDVDKAKALSLKLAAIGCILFAGAVGVCLPIVGRSIPALQPERNAFFVIKAFAAGVILATGMIHVLPDAFDKLGNACLNEDPWGKFPFAGFVAMLSAIGTLVVDSLATGYYQRIHFRKPPVASNGEDAERNEAHDGHVHVHTHGTHGHTHGAVELAGAETLRHRVISQVLELGIIVHSVIIGISLGASESPSTIRPLVAALSFHQFFEGMGLGGCIVQAKFKSRATACMALFFAITTPAGIAVGIGIASVYNENSPTALIVEGCLNAASAGILIYMSLVDLLAADFMNPKMQSNGKLQIWANVSLLFGAGAMSLMAKWA
ncbi:hypothetical protein AMTRI_Chr02g257550 [Amborella trichopoda]